MVVAGPNGSGKTTFVKEFLQVYEYTYLSADTIAESFGVRDIEEVRLKAGREFHQRLSSLINKAESFLVESTLSGVSFERTILRLKQAGYEVTIIFIFLGTPEACVARIRERVRKGGHGIPEADIRRRFSRSIKNFWIRYRTLANCWYLFYNGTAQFHEVAMGGGEVIEVRDETLFDLYMRVVKGG
jgi:predicted ABC-type ATPase